MEIVERHIHLQDLKLEELQNMLDEDNSQEIKDKINNAIDICNLKTQALQVVLDELK